MENNQVRAHAIISGRVQGVFFRMETKKEADRNRVKGWVRNRPDGTVEAVFEGEQNGVIATLEWCKQGSPMAQVNKVDITWEDYRGDYADFAIRYP
jgi:acylphosphatase